MSLELLELLSLLWRRRWVLLASLVLFVGTAVLASVLLPRQYEASTELLVASQDSTASLLNDLGLQEMATSLGSDDIQNKIYLATSEPVVEEVVWRMQLRTSKGRLYEAEDIGEGGMLSALTGSPGLEVTQVPGTDVLVVKATASSPKEAQLMADTLAKVYVQHNTEQARAETREARRFIDEQLLVVTGELDQAFARIAQEQQASEIIDLDSEVKAAVSRLSELLLEQEQLLARVQETRARIRVAREQRALEGSAGVSALSMTTNPVVGDLRTRLTDLRAKRAALLADGYTERAPEVQTLDAQTQATLTELDGAISEMAEFDPAVAALEADLTGLTERAAELDAAIQRTTTAFASYPEKMRSLSQLELAASAAEAVYRSLQDQAYQIGVAEAMTMADVRVVSPATLPDRPSSPKAILNLLAGLVLGLGFGVASAVALELVDDTVKSREQLEAAWELPVLGAVPRYKVGTTPALLRLPPTDPLVEAHRTVRNSISFATIDKPARLLAITSCAPGEGKSTLAINLALSVASEGKRVLLVDADLRLARQHQMFPQLVAAPGLVEVVMREATVEQVVQHPPAEGLSVLTAGDLPQNPAHLVESLRMRQVLADLAKAYDLVIVDTPPVLAVADALVLARHVDGLLLVVESGKTTRRMLAETRSRLEAAGIQPVGVVLNKVYSSNSPYGDYAKYYQSRRPKSVPTDKAGGGAA